MNKEENTLLDQESKKPSFENKIEEAQKLLEQLIDPQITLSKSVEVYKKGMNELETAQQLLESAKLEFKELS